MIAAGADPLTIRKMMSDIRHGQFVHDAATGKPRGGHDTPPRRAKRMDPLMNRGDHFETKAESDERSWEREDILKRRHAGAAGHFGEYRPPPRHRSPQRDDYEVGRVIRHPSMSSSVAAVSYNGVLPTLFVSHGNGCMPLLWEKDHPNLHCFQDLGVSNGLSADNIKCIVIISAHWEKDDDQIGISNTTHNKLNYDYHQAPNECYHLPYAPSGHPGVAKRCFDLLRTKSGNDFRVPNYVSSRGLDHGVFIPLMMIRGFWDIPVVQVGLPWKSRWWERADQAFNVGRSLAPLRREGVLVVGSGQSVNPHRESNCGPQIMAFNNALKAVISEHTGSTRTKHLVNWADLPGAQYAHGRDEHLLPLLVCAGAAEKDCAAVVGDGLDGATPMTHFLFGVGEHHGGSEANSFASTRSGHHRSGASNVTSLTSLTSSSLHSSYRSDGGSGGFTPGSGDASAYAGSRATRWNAHRGTVEHGSPIFRGAR